MKTILWTAYGPPDVLQVTEVDKPVPKDNELLIRIDASTVTAGDCEVRNLRFPIYFTLPMRLYLGIRKPRRGKAGVELAGEVEAIGRDVTRFHVGDLVFGSAGLGMGAYAEYICLPENGSLALQPANATPEEAAAIPTGGQNALHFLGKANLQSGERLLINGAGGSIGTFGVQLAKSMGVHVTAVDSGPKLEMLRSIGADQVIDYTQEDYTQNGQTYDVIFDVVGRHSYTGALTSLNDNGRLLIGNPRIRAVLGARLSARKTNKQVIATLAGEESEHLNTLKELVESGTVKIVIDRRYPLEQTADAQRYVESGRKQGNVIITIP